MLMLFVKTKAYVTVKASVEDPYPLSKVNLKIADDRINFTVTVHNISKTERLTFKPVAILTFM